MRPLFQYYFSPTRRGRPTSADDAIHSAHDKRLTWLKSYPESLYSLRNNPLAWAFQFGVREFFVWAWDMISDDWERHPDLFPYFLNCWPFVWSNKELLGSANTKDISFNHGIPIDLESPPPQNFNNSESFLRRLLDLIRSGPVITIESLHHNGFSIQQMSDFCQLYELALGSFENELKPRRILWTTSTDRASKTPTPKGYSHTLLTDSFYLPLSNQFQYFAIPIYLSNEAALNFVERVLKKDRKIDWAINFDRLCAYGVLEWADMHFFELITGTIIKEDAKLALINRSLDTAIKLRGNAVYDRLDIKYPLKDLRTTRKLVSQILDSDQMSQKLDNLTADAIRFLTQKWRRNHGKGDNLYALSVEEVRSWRWD